MNHKVAIVGLGYVGLPLAMLFSQKGCQVIGIDIDRHKIARLKQGVSYLSDISDEEIATLMNNKSFRCTTDFKEAAKLIRSFSASPRLYQSDNIRT